MKKSILILIGIFSIFSILSIFVFAQPGNNTGVSATILEEPTIVLSNGAGETVYATLNSNDAALCEINWDGIFEEIIGTSDSYTYSDYGLKTVYYRCYAYLPPNEFNFVTVDDGILISEDTDGDGIPDEGDNCPALFNPDQLDIDGDSTGDVCDVCPNDASDNCDTTESATTNINETGGTVATDSGNAEVDIPADALSTDTSISVSGGEETDETDIPAFQVQTGQEAVSLIYSFGPEGTTFDTPVEITLKYDDTGIDESTIDIYFYNSLTSQWEAQGATCDIDLNECTLTVNHFSDYIIGAGSVECYSNAECDDSNSYTEDVCDNPGTVQSSCSYLPIACLADTDCDDSNEYTENVCDNPGTDDSYCSYLSIVCLADTDCGTDGYIENQFCQNDDVWQDYITYTCNNPRISAATCSDSTVPELKEDCTNGCTDGRCKIEVCKTVYSWTGRYEYCVWQ
ncbi:hypothetical protein LCGC14_1563350 [marine sediment metagenome]|uniref:ZU5 domain-containing protein n=1 Tax=marine sediment metagenome TaxID=412755 RepID=A0A0F9LMI1_9ZZZZ